MSIVFRRIRKVPYHFGVYQLGTTYQLSFWRADSVADGGTSFKFQNLYYEPTKPDSLQPQILHLLCLFLQKIPFYDLLLPVYWIQTFYLILLVFQNTKAMWEKHHLYVLPNRLTLATHIHFLDLLIKSSTLLQIWNSCRTQHPAVKEIWILWCELHWDFKSYLW